MTLDTLIALIGSDSSCEVLVPNGQPLLPDGTIMPADLAHFYSLCGGIILFPNKSYGIKISPPDEFIKANPVIVGEECCNDISNNWFIVGYCGEQYITIDCGGNRCGLCYDSFWDRHGVPGDCAIIAKTFTELLERLYFSGGSYWYWLGGDFVRIGDAYDASVL